LQFYFNNPKALYW